jgi:hypothetical protein
MFGGTFMNAKVLHKSALIGNPPLRLEELAKPAPHEASVKVRCCAMSPTSKPFDQGVLKWIICNESLWELNRTLRAYAQGRCRSRRAGKKRPGTTGAPPAETPQLCKKIIDLRTITG